MDLKKLLKYLKLNESTISMILGAIAIIIVGILIINYSGKSKEGETIPAIGTEEEQLSLPTTHTVIKGEDLWKISEKYYKTGYNWTDIAKANNIQNPSIITAGQKLTIPDVEPKFPNKVSPTQTPSPISQAETSSNLDLSNKVISGNSYAVVKGDYLWEIAVRAYGDGYRWVDISRANKLVNPNIIHPGNILTIPR